MGQLLVATGSAAVRANSSDSKTNGFFRRYRRCTKKQTSFRSAGSSVQIWLVDSFDPARCAQHASSLSATGAGCVADITGTLHEQSRASETYSIRLSGENFRLFFRR